VTIEDEDKDEFNDHFMMKPILDEVIIEATHKEAEVTD